MRLLGVLVLALLLGALRPGATGSFGQTLPAPAQPIPTVFFPASVSLPAGATVVFAPAQSRSIFIRLAVTNAAAQTATVSFDGAGLHIAIAPGFLVVVTQTSYRLFPTDGLQDCQRENGLPNAITCPVNITPYGAEVQFTLQAADSSPITYPPGWNLVAGPEGSQLIGAEGMLYTLQPGDTDYEQFPATMALHACLGYWAYFPTGGRLDAAPGPYSGCTVSTAAGEYVMVGNPSAEYEAQPFNSDPDTTLLYSPTTGYHLAMTTIPVGQGAWVISSGPGAAGGIMIQPMPGPQVLPTCQNHQVLTQSGCASPAP